MIHQRNSPPWLGQCVLGGGHKESGEGRPEPFLVQRSLRPSRYPRVFPPDRSPVIVAMNAVVTPLSRHVLGRINIPSVIASQKTGETKIVG